jgi:hypothetical protein
MKHGAHAAAGRGSVGSKDDDVCIESRGASERVKLIPDWDNHHESGNSSSDGGRAIQSRCHPCGLWLENLRVSRPAGSSKG